MARAEHVDRYIDVRRVLLVTLALNWLVALAKLLTGSFTDTLAMVADGFHSLLDGSANLVGLVAIHFAYKPPDEDHQYGHRKYETVSAMVIGVALFAAAHEIVTEAFGRLTDPVLPRVGPLGFVVMGVTLAVNLGVSAYERREGARLGSSLLLSDAQHTRSDVYASSAVIVAMIAAALGAAWLDVVASLAIAGIIVGIGYRIVRDGLMALSDQVMLDPAEVDRVVRRVDGVEGTARIRSRGTPDHVFVDLVCFVPGRMSMSDAHELADHVEEAIAQSFPHVKDIVVHLEPRSKMAAAAGGRTT